MLRDSANIPVGYYKSIPNRSNWLAYILARSLFCLEQNGLTDISDSIHKADAEWLAFHARGSKNG